MFQQIPNGQVAGAPFVPQNGFSVGQANRFCGRYLNNQNTASNANSICSKFWSLVVV